MDLAYPLENSVEINGEEYKLDLSFDNVLRLIDMLNDKRLLPETQIKTGLKMLIGTDLPEYSLKEKEEILYQIFKETIAKDAEESAPVDLEGKPMPQAEEQKRVYSIKQDAPYIYASFYQDYGIDLFEMHGKLHWEKFKALLTGLRPDTKFKEIIEIRTMELPSGKGMEKQRAKIQKLKQIYKLKEDEP